jgi:DNA-binding beta-propeller fold protein YncE
MFQTLARIGVRCSVVLPLALGLAAQAQYNGPESVEYDPVGDRYFVSNTQSQTIKVRAQDATVSTFVQVGAAPYGLEILADTLYACVGGRVKGYALADAALVFDLDLGATFLNGITTDGTYLYCTDFSAGRILKVDPTSATFELLVPNTQGTPNGIVHRPGTEELLVAYWGANAAVRSFDRTTGATIGQVNTSLTNIDGITFDCLGRVLVASWSPDRITAFDWGVISPVFTDLMVPGLNNPADIDFDQVHGRVCIPNSGSNTVQLAEVDCSTGLSAPRTFVTRVLPNPTTGLVRFDPPMEHPEPYMVLDARGCLQATGTLRAHATMDLAPLPDGLYTIVFSRRAQQVRVVKE